MSHLRLKLYFLRGLKNILKNLMSMKDFFKDFKEAWAGAQIQFFFGGCTFEGPSFHKRA